MIAIARRRELARQAGRHLRAPHRSDVRGRQGPHADGGAGDRHRLGRDAGRADGPSRSRARGARAARSPPPARRLREPVTPTSTAKFERPDLVDFNGIGGFTPDGREYVITTTARRPHARAVGERARQSVVRHRRERERRRVHLVRERSRLPADALAQRPGQRHRAARRSTCATRTTAGSGRPRRCRSAAAAALHHPPRLRLQRVRVRRGRHLDRAARRSSRPTRRSSSSSSSSSNRSGGARRLSMTGVLRARARRRSRRRTFRTS